MKPRFFLIFLLLFSLTLCARDTQQGNTLHWPDVTEETKPWSRWWWQGNAVTEEGLTWTMKTYADAEIGGLEITPIYGVHGYEEQFIDYLSSEWMDRLEYTLNAAEQRNMGIDMATGTGWPFGGPWIGQSHACKYLVHRTYQLQEGERLQEPVQYIQEPIASAVRNRFDISEIRKPISANDNLQEMALAQIRFPESLPIQTLMAYSNQGDTLDITAELDENNRLQWTAPEGQWTLYAVFQGWHGKMVERAAPGGEGNVIDHFSAEAANRYFTRFDSAFAGRDISSLRGFFNDSYEVDDARGEADYTPDFFREFDTRQGYDLRHHFASLFAEKPTEMTRRVLSDYREVISDLLLEEFTQTWDTWAEGHGALVRNQAHGSPGNILDLYAAADIPETEGSDIIRFKFASSAAHVTGKPLVSAEAATWLKEHFRSSLGDVKHAVDKYFLGGVNHIVYHGTPYSPPSADWPGWLFYASVHFGPTNAFWKDFPKLNRYVTRCQSFLQKGKPATDILVYFPVRDLWSTEAGSMLRHFDGQVEGTSTREAAEQLLSLGYGFDFISDKQLSGSAIDDGIIRTSGEQKYTVVVVPECRFIPLSTMEALYQFVENGGVVIFQGEIPSDVPGLHNLESREKRLTELSDKLHHITGQSSKESGRNQSSGKVLLGDDIAQLLRESPVSPEPMVKYGLRYVKRNFTDGEAYFVVNSSDTLIKGWIPFEVTGESVALFDPMTGDRGMIPHRGQENGRSEIFLQLRPGETAILRVFDRQVDHSFYPYYEQSGEPYSVTGEWRVHLTKGGPVTPEATMTDTLQSWTNFYSKAGEYFSGTARYTIEFPRPKYEADVWILDLGKVHESAMVRLNNTTLDTLITAPYLVRVSQNLLESENTLVVEVTNLTANRIIYMDRQGIRWKKFYNINLPPGSRENMGPDGLFTAAEWEVLPSGLIGPVRLQPLSRLPIGD